MTRLSIRARLIGGTVLLYALLVGVFVADLVYRQKGFLHQEQVEDVLSLTKGVARASTSAVLAGDIIGVQEVLAAVAETRGLAYSFVVDDDGKVLAHTDRTLAGKYVSDPLSLRLRDGTPEARVVVDDRNLIDVAAPVLEQGRPVGWVRVGVRQDRTRQALDDVVRNGILITLAAIAIGAAFAGWVGTRLTRGLHELMRVARATRDGERERRAIIPSKDEIGVLAVAFNGMLDTLIEKESELRILNDQLEQRVAARTVALTAANEEVRKSEALFRGLLESSADAILLVDGQGKILLANAECSKMFGYERRELIGRPIESVIPDRIGGSASFHAEDADQPGSHTTDSGIAGTGTVGAGTVGIGRQVIGRRNGGAEFPAEIRLSQLQTDDGLIISTVIRDVTERQEAENALTEATRIAEAASRAKSDFLANMSHEIRTPMNAVIGLAHLLGQTSLAPRQRDYLDKIASAANTLLTLLNDILDLSKVEAGKLELEARPFRLDQLLRDLASILSANAQHKDIEVLFDIDPAVPAELVGDSLRLNQILINLAGNAIKFTDHGEVVTSVAPVTLTEDHAVLRFSIRDTGIGITPEQRHRLFQMFNQGDSSTSRRFGGSGLGLSISSRLVTLMGGEMDVDSTPGQGSDFHFTACFDRPAATPPAADLEAAVRNIPKDLRVLIADDNPTAREIMENLASSFGWDADIVGSGEEAIRLFGRAGRPYDIVLLDWKMPGMNGLEVSQKIRDATRGGPTPVIIVVTAYDREMLNRETPENRPDGLLVKPVTASMLFDAVADAFVGPLPAPQPAVPAPESGSLFGLRLLIVEDNLVNQQVASEMMAQAGATVVLANNGVEAIEVFRRQDGDAAFDAILMDIQMPVMDGYAATAALRAPPMATDVPIIAMTANAMASDRERCLAVGMNDHVAKPLVPDVLIRTVHTWTKGLRTKGLDAPGLGAVPAAAVVGPPPDHLRVAGIALSLYQRLGGNEEAFRKLLGSFARQLPTSVAACAAAIAAEDRAEVEAGAHAIRGMAANVGADAVSAAASTIEATAQDSRDPSAPDRFPDMLASLQRAANEVMDGIAQASARWSAGQERSQPVDAGALRAARDALERLLADDNFAATQVFDGLRIDLAAVAGAEAVASLADAIEAFDFARAHHLLADIHLDEGTAR